MKISAYFFPVLFCSILAPSIALAQTTNSKPLAIDANLSMQEKNSALDTQELKALEDVINSVVSLKQENKSLSVKLSQAKNDFNQCVLSVNVEKARNQSALENSDQLKAEIGTLKLQLANEKKGNDTYRKKLESLNALLSK